MKFFRDGEFGNFPRFRPLERHRSAGNILFSGAAFFGAALVFSACSSGAPQLSVKLQNPKTGQTLFCTASNSNQASDASSNVLASAVETCARQLEAQGFVREN